MLIVGDYESDVKRYEKMEKEGNLQKVQWNKRRKIRREERIKMILKG